MSKFKIILHTGNPTKTAEEVISTGLGFKNTLSSEAIIFHFATENTIKNGFFKSANSAFITKERINAACQALGMAGVISHGTFAEIVKV